MGSGLVSSLEAQAAKCAQMPSPSKARHYARTSTQKSNVTYHCYNDRFGDPSPKVDPGAFSGQKQGWKIPKRTPWQCTASVCVMGVLEISSSVECDICLSCRFILGFSSVWLFVSSLITDVLLY